MYPSSPCLPRLPPPHPPSPLPAPLLCWPAPLRPSRGRFLPQLGVLGCVAACLYWSVDFLVAACTYLNIPRPLLFVPGLVQSLPTSLPSRPPHPSLSPFSCSFSTHLISFSALSQSTFMLPLFRSCLFPFRPFFMRPSFQKPTACIWKGRQNIFLHHFQAGLSDLLPFSVCQPEVTVPGFSIDDMPS